MTQDQHDKRDWWLLGAATLILIAPLWLVQTPALPDYPAHLASFSLIGGAPSRFYHLDWVFVPYLASEVIVPVLGKLVGIEIAAKLFLSITLGLWVIGPGLIQRALYGRVGLAPLLAAFFAYNANFLWGFMNYAFAAGLCFVLFAAWLKIRTQPSTKTLALFSLAVTALYFCHIFAAATLALLIAGVEIGALWRDPGALARRTVQAAALYLPAALAFAFLRPASAGDTSIQFNLADTMMDRFESLTLHNFSEPAYALPLLLGAGLLLALILRRAHIATMLWPALALLLAATLCAPEWAMGGWAVHLRLPAFAAALLLAVTRFALPPRLTRALAGAALVLLAWNAAALAANWRDYDRQYREFRDAVKALAPGKRVMTVIDYSAMGPVDDRPYWHMAEFAILDRAAMTQLMFTTRGQHTVQLNAPYAPFAAATAQQGSPPGISALPLLAAGDMSRDEDFRETFPYLKYFQCHYDIAVVVSGNGKLAPVPAVMRLRHAGSFFALYDIAPDKACAP